MLVFVVQMSNVFLIIVGFYLIIWILRWFRIEEQGPWRRVLRQLQWGITNFEHTCLLHSCRNIQKSVHVLEQHVGTTVLLNLLLLAICFAAYHFTPACDLCRRYYLTTEKQPNSISSPDDDWSIEYSISHKNSTLQQGVTHALLNLITASVSICPEEHTHKRRDKNKWRQSCK